MGTTYTRQESASITDGSVIEASHFNNEFNQVEAAFAASTGHQHDGTAGEGGYVPLIADTDANNKLTVDTANNRFGVFVEVASSPVEQFRFQDGAIVPVTDNDIDLGTGSLEFKDLYLDGTANIDTLVIGSSTGVTSVDTDLSSVSASDDTLASAKAIKTYIDAQVTAQDLDFQADTGGALSIDLDSESLTFTGGTGIDTSGSGNAVTFAIDSTVATLTGTQTLTNKTIDTANNTITIVEADISDLGAYITASSADTLTNKTINSASNTITITEADISDLGSYITASSSDTLTNKSISLTTNTLSGTTAEFNTALSDGSFTTLAGTETLTNKTLTSPVLNTGVSGTAVLDDDTFATASSTTLATSESIKAYVDNTVANSDTLAELNDTSISTPSGGDLLIYDGTDSFDNVTVSGDVTINSSGVTAIGTGVIVNADINASAAIDATKIHDGTVSNTEFGYLNGVTGAIQTQIDGKQASDAELTAIAGLTSAADKGIQFTGSGTAATYDLTAAGKALLDDADASAQRTTLGLGTAATLNVGTGANNIVQLDGSGLLPAVDGSQLTNLPSAGATQGFAIAMAVAL